MCLHTPLKQQPISDTYAFGSDVSSSAGSGTARVDKKNEFAWPHASRPSTPPDDTTRAMELHEAIKGGDEGLAASLLEKGDVSDEAGDNPLRVAAADKNS